MNPDKRLNKAAELLKVLSIPARMRIVNLLSQQGEMNVSNIVGGLGMDQSLVSHHLVKMADTSLLQRRRQGKESFYSLSDPVLGRIMQMVIK